MSVVLTRIDDRLIHGQVVVGWGQALRAQRIVLVDDTVCASPWEQELYSLGVPSGLAVEYVSVDRAVEMFAAWQADRSRTIVLVPDVTTIVRLCEGTHAVERVNVGGLHDQTGRAQRLTYVYLSDEEASQLRHLSERGVEVTAQDVPTARAVPVEDWA
ncbi:MAG: PTS sugar transporter subunit IIB [Gemmatimonadales bacterium]|jgi:mannose/fructose/N-acetylgalactosamine-specific phosphotransferase system component IIB|nr:PTS sugar transporter subunit IIB [Gemmatimonadales bacterium]